MISRICMHCLKYFEHGMNIWILETDQMERHISQNHAKQQPATITQSKTSTETLEKTSSLLKWHPPGDTINIYMDLSCISTDEMLCNIPMHVISTIFQPFFASTIAGIQGAKIGQPFSKWEMSRKTFDRNLLNSASGRSTCREHVHLCLRMA